MHTAVDNLRSLLIKWGVCYAVLVFVATGFLIRPEAANSQTPQEKEESSDYLGWPLVADVKNVKKPNSTKKYTKPLKRTKSLKTVSTRNANKSARPNASPAGNSYARGHCTWYAKNKRPDMPNNLGNANTWASRAQAQGIATGSEPKIGAIAQAKRGMHVVYVEKVNSDGTITFSEMNYRGRGVVSTRTLPADSFKYIY